MEINKELDLAFNFIEKTNRNLFLTGKAGTGKTTFLHKIKATSMKRMIVVAPTGVAAINAKGVTIHSFFQLSFDPFIPNANEQKATTQRKFSKTKIDIIKSLDLVIIDEISMVRADVLDGIDAVLRRYKDRTKPFGGVQLLLIGDLQQLSPVVRPNEWQLLKNYYQTAYFFSSIAYQKAAILAIELKHIYRQQNQAFIAILNEIRNNALSKASAEILNKQYQPNFHPKKEDGYITLTTHNNRADAINQKQLDSLDTHERTYVAEISGDFNEKAYPNSENLVLKEGAQVMFIKNDSSIEKRYYNGKIGTIVHLDDEVITVQCSDDDFIETTYETWENIKYTLNKETKEISNTIEGTYTQIPLRLAWAITIHKSQGLTFDKAIIDAEASFAHGQTYVALSRCKTLEGIVLKTPIKAASIISDTTVNTFTEQLEENEPDEAELKASKKTFQLDLISEIFDYNPFLYPVKRLIDLYYKNKNSLTGNILQPLETIKDKGIIPLMKVNTKFKSQLASLAKNSENPEQDATIQARFKKAVEYFTAQTKQHIAEVLSTFTFATDNQAVSKDIEKQLKAIEEKLAVKIKILEGVSDQFSTENYLKLRANAILEVSEVKVIKRPVATSTSHEELFEDLRLFRLSVSNSENVPPFQIFTQKSLFEMCELLPSTPKQLKKIHGMGKVRVEKYGEEILEIINDYVTQNNLSSMKDDVIIKVEKKNTKETSLDFFKEGFSIEEIAEKRALAASTIFGHLGHYVLEGVLEITEILAEEKVTKGLEIIKNNTFEGLNELKEIAGTNFSYNELRILLKYSEKK
ncbi:HRDC domain-containing protein [Kordia algicida OT-1]|uniref:DNA repair and recombination protein, putative helicase n=1 Tax=Kordia algicida OT-1 TaxID=391587 RepID=A9DRF3_9FLAO|nr:HRDC domain-containing protein [Kordia algicida]EDP96785.1 DNA repair and recombination protein, putative helicase [Kordia algicida OT-1]